VKSGKWKVESEKWKVESGKLLGICFAKLSKNILLVFLTAKTKITN